MLSYNFLYIFKKVVKKNNPLLKMEFSKKINYTLNKKASQKREAFKIT